MDQNQSDFIYKKCACLTVKEIVIKSVCFESDHTILFQVPRHQESLEPHHHSSDTLRTVSAPLLYLKEKLNSWRMCEVKFSFKMNFKESDIY